MESGIEKLHNTRAYVHNEDKFSSGSLGVKIIITCPHLSDKGREHISNRIKDLITEIIELGEK